MTNKTMTMRKLNKLFPDTALIKCVDRNQEIPTQWRKEGYEVKDEILSLFISELEDIEKETEGKWKNRPDHDTNRLDESLIHGSEVGYSNAIKDIKAIIEKYKEVNEQTNV